MIGGTILVGAVGWHPACARDRPRHGVDSASMAKPSRRHPPASAKTAASAKTPAPTAPRQSSWLALAVFAIALAVRWLYLYQASDAPTFAVPIVDAAAYDQLARELATTGVLGKGFFWQSPLYPLFLALVYAASGTLLTAKLLQTALGALTCALVFLLGERLLGRREGLIAAAITAFYGPLIYFETELVAAGLAALFSVLLVGAWLAAEARPDLVRGLLLGFCSILAVLTRPTFLLPVLAGAVWLLLHARRTAGVRRLGAGLALGFLPLALGVAAAGARFADYPSFLPASGGLNLYIGNHPEACRLLNTRLGHDWRRLVEEPRRAGISGLGPESRYFYHRALANAAAAPSDFLAGLGAKTLRLLSARELPRNTDLYLFREDSALLAASVWKLGRFGFPFGLLLPLVVAGFFSRQLAWQLWLFLAAAGLALVLVFVSARYRVELVPISSLPAAAGVLALGRSWRPALAAIAALGVAVVSGPFCEEGLNYRAELCYALGFERSARGDLAGGIADYRQAVALDPALAEAHGDLGRLLLGRGDVAGAASHLEQAVRLAPGIAADHELLAEVLLRLGRVAESTTQLEHVVVLEPERAEIRFQLGELLVRLGRRGEALGHLQAVLVARPDWPPVLARLGWVLATAPEPELRDGAQALVLTRRANDLTGNRHPIFLDALAAAQAENGAFAEAAHTEERALAAIPPGGDATVAPQLRGRLELYRAGRPYRDETTATPRGAP